MHVYRLCKQIYSADVLDGQGARSAAGRWHSEGHRIVYCASSEALAVLELRVHLGPYVPHSRYVMHTIEVPDEIIADLAAEALPAGWDAVPHTETSRTVGEEWLESARSVALRLPSIHSKTDRTVLLNPVHREFQRVRVLAHRPYRLDHRLFGASALRESLRESAPPPPYSMVTHGHPDPRVLHEPTDFAAALEREERDRLPR